VWWVCLVVLVLNDHVLKGAGVLPGWLTGKLSDVAGLVVAPVLAAVLLRAQTPRARWVAFAVVALPFAALNLSSAFAHAVEALTAALGVPWRVTVDPTDLCALVVLPVAAWVLQRPARAPGVVVRRRSAWVPRVGAVLASVACMATSRVEDVPPGQWQTDAYVLNRSGEARDVRLRWVSGEIDCDRVQREPGRYLTPTMFSGLRVTFRVEASETIPLQRAAALAASADTGPDAPPPGDARTCDAVMIGVDGMPDTLAFWSSLPARGVALRPAAAANTAGQVDLAMATGGQLRLEAPSGDVRLEVVPVLDQPSACAPVGLRYEWTGAVPVDTVEARTLRDAPGGCTAVEYRDPGDQGGTLYLCMPREVIPFAAGERFTARSSGESDAARTLVLEGPTLRTTVFTGTLTPMASALLGLNVLERAVCTPRRLGCGAVTEPVALDLVGLSAPLMPGTTATLAGTPARRVSLGRAERVVVSSSACVDFNVLGLRADLTLTQPR